MIGVTGAITLIGFIVVGLFHLMKWTFDSLARARTRRRWKQIAKQEREVR